LRCPKKFSDASVLILGFFRPLRQAFLPVSTAGGGKIPLGNTVVLLTCIASRCSLFLHPGRMPISATGSGVLRFPGTLRAPRIQSCFHKLKTQSPQQRRVCFCIKATKKIFFAFLIRFRTPTGSAFDVMLSFGAQDHACNRSIIYKERLTSSKSSALG